MSHCLSSLTMEFAKFFIGVGSTGESSLGRNLFEKAQGLGFVVTPCIHPGAVISPSPTFWGRAKRLSGDVVNCEDAHVGIEACVRQCICIGRSFVVGAGAAVVSDVPDDAIVVGVPARPLRKVKA